MLRLTPHLRLTPLALLRRIGVCQRGPTTHFFNNTTCAMGLLNIVGWGSYIIGGLLWLYGYLVTGTKALVDWASISPGWIADFMPNLEAEMGMLVMCIAMVPLCWNAIKQHSAQ